MAALHSHQDVSASLGKVEGKIIAYDNDDQSAALGTIAYESTEEEKARNVSSSDIERATEAEETRRFLLTSEGKKAERRFLVKLDIILLTWAWFAYCIKIIDDTNYRTAYVSGMREALNMDGNELNYLETVFRVGYSVCLIPSQIILMKLPASWWLPPLELTWGILTALMAFAKNVNGMYALRFFIGCLEASSYPGIIAILCLWYTPTELVTRLSIFSSSYPGAMIFTSFMQAALHKNMNGKAGLAGWQWLFIINALMTVVIAAAGFIFLPDKPGHSRVYWLTADEDRIARSRVDRVKRLAPTPMSWVGFKRIFYNPVMWFFTFAYSFWSWSQNANVWFALFLKSVKNSDGTARFSVPQINTIPIGGYVLMIIAQLFFAWLSDRTGWRASLVVAQQVLLVIGAITLSVWPSSFGVKMWAFFMCWLSNAGGPTLIAWMADYTPSPEDRAIVVGIGITLVFSMNAWMTVLVYPAKEAPNYRVGYKAASAFGIACILVTAAWKYYSRNTFSAWEEEKRLDREEDEETRTADK